MKTEQSPPAPTSNKKRFRQIIVKKQFRLTKNMQRIIFSGEQLSDFPENFESGYVKLLFNLHGQPISE